MCVILVGRVTESLYEQALSQNGDGFSVFTEKGGLMKSPTKAQVKQALNKFAIWHFRIATSGKVTDYNVHPFPVCGGDYLLYHNGVLGAGLGNKSDTHALASTLMDVDYETAESALISLASSRNRFLLADTANPKSFKLFGSWEVDAGVLMSHKMYTYAKYTGVQLSAIQNSSIDKYYEEGGYSYEGYNKTEKAPK